uniref:Cellulose binding protein n=1 Tax=Heterodera schachtii TaxID=97005 RepID=B0FGT7_HETSC|nr:cellulose binding protein precursor [Heterodera schachtii]
MNWMHYCLIACFSIYYFNTVESSTINSVTVQVNKIENNEKGRQFNLKFTNQVYERVCHVDFRVDLPDTAKLDKYSKMVPIPDTCGQYALPKSLDLLPGETFDAQLTLLGHDGKPNVTVLNTNNIPTSKQCKK